MHNVYNRYTPCIYIITDNYCLLRSMHVRVPDGRSSAGLNLYIYMYIYTPLSIDIVEGSLNSKLPTIWRVEKADETGSQVKSKKMH